ncbi:MAG: hypothetical protein ABI370_10190 [Gammaproteobacteria bacterium]
MKKLLLLAMIILPLAGCHASIGVDPAPTRTTSTTYTAPAASSTTYSTPVAETTVTRY